MGLFQIDCLRSLQSQLLNVDCRWCVTFFGLCIVSLGFSESARAQSAVGGTLLSQTSTSGDKTTTYTANKITKITATFKLTWEHHGLQEATGWYKVTAYDENGKKLGKSILKQVDCAPKKETVREVTASTVLTERETKDNKFVYFDIELGFAEDGAGFDDTASVGAIFMRD